MSRVGARAIEAHASRSMAVDLASPVIHVRRLPCSTNLNERLIRHAMCFEHHVIDNTSFENLVRHVYPKGVSELYKHAKAVL